MSAIKKMSVAGEIDMQPDQARVFVPEHDVALSTGTRFRGYRLGARCSVGRDADVWEAVDDRGRPVVIKVAARRDACFDRDAIDMCRLAHPNLVAVLIDGQLLDGRPYAIFERVDGVQLRRWLSQGALNLEATCSILTQLGRALAAAHARGIVHGQITPEHILICEGDPVRYPYGQVKLLGLGTTLGAGNPAYRAPEQLTRGSIGKRADLFALGVLAVEMLTRRGPFHCDSLRSERALARRWMAPKVELPDEVAHVRPALLRALAVAPDDRWATVGELVKALTGETLAPLARGSATLICPTHEPPDDGAQISWVVVTL